MKKIIYYGLVTVLLSACGSSRISIMDSKEITFEMTKIQPLNYGDSFPVVVYNVNQGGEKSDISENLQLKVYGDGINYIHSERMLYIDKRPTERDISILSFQAVLKEKGDSIVYPQKLKLDFSGPLSIDLSGDLGKKGF